MYSKLSYLLAAFLNQWLEVVILGGQNVYPAQRNVCWESVNSKTAFALRLIPLV